MKKIIYITGVFAFLMIFTTSAFAQIRKIPAEVTNAFQEKYPNATSVEWRYKLSSFTATFQLDGTSYIPQFNGTGEWDNTEEAIDQNKLTEAVTNGIDKSKYAEWNIGHVTRIEMPNDEVQYKIEVSKGDIKKRNLYYNSEGRMLKDKLTL